MIKITHVWANNFDSFVDDVINDIELVTIVILDCLVEVDHYDRVFSKQDIDRLLDITQQHNVPVKILTSNSNKNPIFNNFSHVSVICWDTFWFLRTYNTWLKHEDYNITKGIDIRDDDAGKHFELTYPYVCLNNIIKRHRCIMLDLLAKHDLIRHGAIAWRGVCHSKINHYEFNYWKPEILILDQGLDVKFNQETMPLEFNNSFMQLVTETEDTETCITEKTATPILLNKPFLVAANVGFHRTLQNKGFHLYDELFDYSFDDEVDITVRYEKIAENVKRYIGLNPVQLKEQYNKVSGKISHNRRIAMEYATKIPDDILELYWLIRKNNIEHGGSLNNIKST